MEEERIGWVAIGRMRAESGAEVPVQLAYGPDRAVVEAAAYEVARLNPGTEFEMVRVACGPAAEGL